MNLPSFNIETAEGKMLNYYVQSQQADRRYRKRKSDTETVDVKCNKAW